jgi:hypothetical protein
MKTPLKKCEFWFKMSFFMFNMTHVLKNCIDKNQKYECKYSECAIFIRDLMSGRLKANEIKMDLKHLMKQIQYVRSIVRVVRRDIKRGVYKAVYTIDSENTEAGIIDNG